ncbi:dioxygenase family protein [Microlunatus antarcticus]|uniref:Protocatechuate 3,4-dioxygenase beta subunit n=1 Tax=Microlunatus antarcticus TaxID=53388 RepID=A0A7W5JUR1_9ACTN|nr:protocatechuate 3,4-dioxygenase beta subunit [Microlunatus antarcticus]
MQDDRSPQTYEGRPYDRPEEELTDQGLRFDVVTVLSRRNLLRALGLGATAVTLAACGADATTSSTPTGSSASTSSGEIPDETAGPYPGDGSNGPDVLEQSGIVRSDIRSSFGEANGTAEGVPLTIALTVRDLANAGAAFAGAAVYVWHCDRDGGYSLYSDQITGENYLRGVQVAGADGTVTFTSIFPACYTGRWPHIHFEVYPDQASIVDSTKAISTSQVALPKEACDAVYATDGYATSVSTLAQVSLADDNVFGDDDGASQLGTVTGDVEAGYRVALDVGVDTRTAPAAGQAPGGRGGGRPPGAPPSR